MVIKVEYHINRKYFLKNKKAFQKIFLPEAFEISVMKFEKGMSYVEIATNFGYSALKIRKILSVSCLVIRSNGFKV